MDLVLSQLAVGILIGAVYGLFSVGLSLGFGVLRVVNFAHGDLVVVGMFSTYFIATATHFNPYLAILIAVPGFVVLALVLYPLLIRKSQAVADTEQLVATLGLSIVLEALAELLFGNSPRSIPKTGILGQNVSLGDATLPIADIVAGGTGLVLTLALFAVIRLSRVGRQIRATVANRRVAELLGVNATTVFTLAFVIAVVLAAIGGGALVTYLPTTPQLGQQLVLLAFISVVMGGAGDIVGTFLAALVVGVAETLTGFYWATSVQDVVPYFLFIVIALFRPRGLLGRAIAIDEGR